MREGAESGAAKLPEEPIERVRAVLGRIVEELGLAAEVSVAEDEDEIRGDVDGEDVGLLIGRHGQTIDALQYLANAIGHRAHGDERPRVVVDAAGYRARRAATLETVARRAAEQAAATGHRVELEPMTAVERRIVHELLKDDPESVLNAPTPELPSADGKFKIADLFNFVEAKKGQGNIPAAGVINPLGA